MKVIDFFSTKTAVKNNKLVPGALVRVTDGSYSLEFDPKTNSLNHTYINMGVDMHGWRVLASDCVLPADVHNKTVQEKFLTNNVMMAKGGRIVFINKEFLNVVG